MTHPLVAPRRIVRHAFVLVVVAGCVVAGFWQLVRLHQVRAYNARVHRQLREAPRPLGTVIRPGAHADAHAVSYRRVVAVGRYDRTDEVVLVGRELGDNPGNDVLTPLVLSDGRTLLVNRGWVRFGMDRPPVKGAAPPAGVVRVTGVLFPSDAHGAPSESRVLVLTKVDLGRLRRQLPSDTLPVYLWLERQSPPSGPFPRAMPLPALTEGPHFSYAVQWFLFATVGVVGYPILLRRERRSRLARPSRPPRALSVA
jgi:cytochrome oxidase assembly protein ShyY1